MNGIKKILEQNLNFIENDNSTARAKLARDLIKQIYNFVKFNRPEGGGLDGRDGLERNSLADIVDAVEDHYYSMLEKEHKDK